MASQRSTKSNSDKASSHAQLKGTEDKEGKLAKLDANDPHLKLHYEPNPFDSFW